MDEIELKIKEAMKERVDIENVTLDTKLETLDIDSLDLVETMMDLEEAFDVTFDQDEIVGLKTVKDLVDLVKSKLQ